MIRNEVYVAYCLVTLLPLREKMAFSGFIGLAESIVSDRHIAWNAPFRTC